MRALTISLSFLPVDEDELAKVCQLRIQSTASKPMSLSVAQVSGHVQSMRSDDNRSNHDGTAGVES
ncbi:uncharacterized protein CPUR_08755 [Claviceps purpurea 20.1]|uniref:Uncharacterized protein n=1 Tax=Claviceps purpurea (strain 20.1) TaxID=1111077 RepID=M1W6R2_CLAP2|nr:uncharacterized protein CPUR_08755 [Claviceps purpurea 20.1]